MSDVATIVLYLRENAMMGTAADVVEKVFGAGRDTSDDPNECHWCRRVVADSACPECREPYYPAEPKCSCRLVSEAPPVSRDDQARTLGYRDAADADAQHAHAARASGEDPSGWPHRQAGKYDDDRHRPECECEACDAYEQGYARGFGRLCGESAPPSPEELKKITTDAAAVIAPMVEKTTLAMSTFESAIRLEVQSQILASEEQQAASARAETDLAREKLLEYVTHPILISRDAREDDAHEITYLRETCTRQQKELAALRSSTERAAAQNAGLEESNRQLRLEAEDLSSRLSRSPR